MGKAQKILIAGPYRSGTNDDAELIRKNVEWMESYAVPIIRAGHIPVPWGVAGVARGGAGWFEKDWG